jgi:hypothetical protein
MARTWTGFEMRAPRGNTEHLSQPSTSNDIDPMKVQGAKRDVFPKMNLDGGHIGDGFPLCEHLPKQAFLHKGATYRFLGSNPAPTQVQDPPELASDSENITRVELSSGGNSALYKVLCNAAPSDPNTCRYQSQMVSECSSRLVRFLS